MKWIKTNYPGVRFREHPTRKHGVRQDRYFTIRYRIGGVLHEEPVGWASKGVTAEEANLRLSKLKEKYRDGEGLVTLREQERQGEERRQAEEKQAEAARQESAPFDEIFSKHYLPHAEFVKKKKKGSIVAEKALYNKWIKPVIGSLPMGDIAQIQLERISRNMETAGLSPRSVHYALCVIRQLYHFARNQGLTTAPSPTDKARTLLRRVKSADNARIRFLTAQEAELLLRTLFKRSPETYEQTLLSLHCGLRAGELFSLTWADVNLDAGILTLRDTKSGKTRAAYLTAQARSVLAEKTKGRPNDYVFPADNGKRREKISNTFRNVVEELGLNEGITDPRQKVVFHSCRHSYASFLVDKGVDLYRVKTLMGHSELKMTERYSHVRPDALLAAVKTLEQTLPEPVKVDVKGDEREADKEIREASNGKKG